MAAHLFCFSVLILAAMSIGAMENQVIKGAAYYKIFDTNGNSILHSLSEMEFFHAREKCLEENNLSFYDEFGRVLKRESCPYEDFGSLCQENSHTECVAVDNFLSSSVCQTIESKLDPKTKPKVVNIEVLASEDESSKYITFFRDNECEDNVVCQKINLQDLNDKQIDHVIERIKFFINMNKKVEKNIRALCEDSEESSSGNDCVIS